VNSSTEEAQQLTIFALFSWTVFDFYESFSRPIRSMDSKLIDNENSVFTFWCATLHVPQQFRNQSVSTAIARKIQWRDFATSRSLPINRQLRYQGCQLTNEAVQEKKHTNSNNSSRTIKIKITPGDELVFVSMHYN